MKHAMWLFVLAILTLGIEPTAEATVVDYRSVTDGIYPSLSLGGTTVTGSSNITSGAFAGIRGLGVSGGAGGAGDLSLDTGETMTIDLGHLSTNVHLTLVDIPPPGNVTFAFEAFDGLTSLGSFNFPAATMAPEIYDLSALDGGQDMSSFIISVGSPSSPLGLQIQAVSFDTIPEPGTLTLTALGLLAIGAARRRKN